MSDEPEELECNWCGDTFIRPYPRGRPPEYCRPSCRQRAFEARQARELAEEILRLRSLIDE